MCNIREKANHFSWNPPNKACSCYDTDPCSPDTSTYSMTFKSFKIIDNGWYSTSRNTLDNTKYKIILPLNLIILISNYFIDVAGSASRGSSAGKSNQDTILL